MVLAAATCTLLGMGTSKAAVTLTFEQVGLNIVVTWSGNYDIPTDPPVITSFVNGMDFDSDGVVSTSGGNYSYLPGSGQLFPSSLPAATLSINGGYIGDSFGFFNDDLFYPAGTPAGIFSPTGTMTVNNMTLAALGADSFNNTLAFRGTGSVSGSRDIFLTTVPEPSAALLGLIGVVAGAFTRKRRA